MTVVAPLVVEHMSVVAPSVVEQMSVVAPLVVEHVKAAVRMMVVVKTFGNSCSNRVFGIGLVQVFDDLTWV